MYIGRCRQFKYKDRLATGHYFNFKAEHDSDIIDIYFIHEGKTVQLCLLT